MSSPFSVSVPESPKRSSPSGPSPRSAYQPPLAPGETAEHCWLEPGVFPPPAPSTLWPRGESSASPRNPTLAGSKRRPLGEPGGPEDGRQGAQPVDEPPLAPGETMEHCGGISAGADYGYGGGGYGGYGGAYPSLRNELDGGGGALDYYAVASPTPFAHLRGGAWSAAMEEDLIAGDAAAVRIAAAAAANAAAAASGGCENGACGGGGQSLLRVGGDGGAYNGPPLAPGETMDHVGGRGGGLAGFGGPWRGPG